MQEYQLREPYNKCKAKEYNDFKEFFREEIRLSLDEDKKTIKDKFENIQNKLKSSRVWLLFASNDEKTWTCLQVAHKKYNIQGEIEEDIEFLLSRPIKNFKNVTYTNSAFYEKVCPKLTDVEYRKLLYSKISNEYKYFQICLLDVDKYLKINSNNNRTDTERIIEICKNQYAEAKIAYESLAVYWRHVSSGIDGQTISYIANHTSEFNS